MTNQHPVPQDVRQGLEALANAPASEPERLFPAWYHDLQVESAQTQIAGDIRQREALVAWIADIDERVRRNTATVKEHRRALQAQGCTQSDQGIHHRLPCPVHEVTQ
jgi:hypothetical protein